MSKHYTKSNMVFDEWIESHIAKEALGDYKKKHLIPQEVALSFDNFEEFSRRGKT